MLACLACPVVLCYLLVMANTTSSLSPAVTVDFLAGLSHPALDLGIDESGLVLHVVSGRWADGGYAGARAGAVCGDVLVSPAYARAGADGFLICAACAS